MKKSHLLVIAVIIVLIIGIYLNRAYGHIFNNIKLNSSDSEQTYTMGSSKDALTYVAIGDSLTSGVGIDDYKESYPYLLAQKLSTDKKIVLKDVSYPGYKTEDVKEKLLDEGIADKPDMITLFIGVNDVRSSVSKETFETNYKYILDRLTKETSAKIYLINVPMIGENVLPPYDEYFDLQTRNFNSIIKSLAENYGLSYIDIYTPTKEEFKKSNEYYSSDLFHPSAKGYAYWAQIIYDNINH